MGTLDELCDGIVKLKKAMAGLDRAIAYLRKIFAEADGDKSGFLSKEEFVKLLSNLDVKIKLESFGVSMDEVDDVWAAVDAEDDGRSPEGISAEEMVGGFLAMREPSSNVTRALNYMRQVFKQADT